MTSPSSTTPLITNWTLTLSALSHHFLPRFIHLGFLWLCGSKNIFWPQTPSYIVFRFCSLPMKILQSRQVLLWVNPCGMCPQIEDEVDSYLRKTHQVWLSGLLNAPVGPKHTISSHRKGFTTSHPLTFGRSGERGGCAKQEHNKSQHCASSPRNQMSRTRDQQRVRGWSGQRESKRAQASPIMFYRRGGQTPNSTLKY